MGLLRQKMRDMLKSTWTSVRFSETIHRFTNFPGNIYFCPSRSSSTTLGSFPAGNTVSKFKQPTPFRVSHRHGVCITPLGIIHISFKENLRMTRRLRYSDISRATAGAQPSNPSGSQNTQGRRIVYSPQYVLQPGTRGTYSESP